MCPQNLAENFADMVAGLLGNPPTTVPKNVALVLIKDHVVSAKSRPKKIALVLIKEHVGLVGGLVGCLVGSWFVFGWLPGWLPG